MAIGKTYLTGNTGLFQVYDHTTTVWTDYSGFTTANLLDVKTDPINFNYAIICGLNYIGYTTNAGLTIQTATTIGVTSVSRAFQISIPESVTSAIYICGTNGTTAGVIKSIDGGITYSNAFTGITYSGATARTIHFKDDLIGVVGVDNKIFKTVNGGLSWNSLNGNNPIAVGEFISGIHISANEQVIIAVTDKHVYRSTNSGISFSLVYTIDSVVGYQAMPLKYAHLTWYDDSNMWISAGRGPIVYSSNAGLTWSEVYPGINPNDDGRSIFGSHFYTLTKGFFTVDDETPPIYGVYQADNATTAITATQSLTYNVNKSPASAVWTLLKNDVYLLVSCIDDTIYMYSDTPELSNASGKVIKIVGSDSCWLVSIVNYTDQTLVDVAIAINSHNIPQIFADCECCLPTPPPAPVKYVRSEPKADRTFYKIAQSQCDITANVKFANAYYNIFKQIRYGIASNCEVDEHKILLKKELSDLATLYDPTACVITTPVKSVVCPEPEGHPFVPPVTYSFLIGGGFVDGTFNCTQCLDGTNPGLYVLCPKFNIILDYNILDTIDPNATYIFSYNGGCVFTLGSAVESGSLPNLETYILTAANIVNTGVGAPDPCASCGG